MKRKIKFGFSTLLAMTLSLNFALAQQSKPIENPTAPNSAADYPTLKKDWDNFQAKAEANATNPAQKPVLTKEYNDLVDKLEGVCEGVKPAMSSKVPLKTATSVPVPGDKPKKEQVSVMK